MVSNICVEFGIPPVLGGALEQPVGLTSKILRLRQYHHAYQMVNGLGQYANMNQAEIPTEASDFIGVVKAAREWEDRRAELREQAEVELLAAYGLVIEDEEEMEAAI